MSICRWSECDLYIFESEIGIQCYVASNRVDGNGQRRAIGLPRDGEAKTFGTWGELLDYVRELKALGYDVPDRVIDDIAAETAANTD